MLNSPEYRRLYTQIFHSMNPGPNGISPNDNDRLLRSNRKSHRQKHRHSSKRHSFPTVPVIGTTMPNDSLLNDLIDHCEQERRSSVWFDERFLQDFNHCRYCWKKVSSDQRHLIEHEERCRSRADSRRYQTRMSWKKYTKQTKALSSWWFLSTRHSSLRTLMDSTDGKQSIQRSFIFSSIYSMTTSFQFSSSLRLFRSI